MDKGTNYSEINTHEVIVLLEVTGAKPGAWMKDPTNPLNQRRVNDVSVRIGEWYQGDSPLGKGSTLTFSVTQRKPISGRIADYYGPWSGVDLESHPHVLVFCNRSEQQESPEHMFPHCGLAIQVPNRSYPYALEDMRLVTSLKQNPAFPQFLTTQGFREMMIETRKKAGPLLGRFLIDTMPREDSHVAADPLYELLEAGNAQVMLRAVLLMHLVEQMTLLQDPPLDERIRLIRAMVRILQESTESARMLQEGIEQAYLYNTVFDSSGKPYLSADQVFVEEKERAAAIATVGRARFSESHRDKLFQWLRPN